MQCVKNLKVNMEQKILESSKVVVVPHNGIDFDAMGSAIGLSVIARKLRKPSCIVVDDPVYKIDHGVKLVMDDAKRDFTIIPRDKYLQMAEDNDLFILTDVNKSYLVSINDQLEKDRTIIIDHHESDQNTIEASETFIDTSVSSASEVVAKLLCMYKIKPTPEVANYLLAGIYLDTNKLRKNVSPETMGMVTKLLSAGASMDRVTDLFVEDFESDRRIQELVGKAKMTNISIATVFGAEDAEYTREELAKVADYLLRYGVDASFAGGYIGDGVIAVSARSKEKVNVGTVMKEMGGGGNPYSAATRLTDTNLEEVGKKLMKIIQPPCYIK